MIMKCPRDQSELVDNLCSQCYTLFFEAKDMIGLEIDAKIIWPDAEFPLTVEQSESLGDIFDSVRHAWKSVDDPNEEAFIYSSPFIKVHRFAVDDQELKGLYHLARSMADLLWAINKGEISRGDPKLRELNQAFYKRKFLKPDQIKIGYDSTPYKSYTQADDGYFDGKEKLNTGKAPSDTEPGKQAEMTILRHALDLPPIPEAGCDKTLDECPDRYPDFDAFDPAKRRK